jgi:hypothetical protein
VTFDSSAIRSVSTRSKSKENRSIGIGSSLERQNVRHNYACLLFNGKRPDMPLTDPAAFKRAAKEIEGGEQDSLPF